MIDDRRKKGVGALVNILIAVIVLGIKYVLINWRHCLRVCTLFGLLFGVLFGMVTCTLHVIKIDEQNTAIRAANGGVIPGKEAIDNNGGRYNLQTIIHNGNEYTCFSTGSAMGCAKE